MIIRSAGILEDVAIGRITDGQFFGVFNEHQREIERFNLLDDYYKGNHQVLKRNECFHGQGRPENKIVHNYAKYIVVMTVGYLLGDKVKYTAHGDLKPLNSRFLKASMYDADEEIAKDMSIFGRGYELLYLWGEEEPIAKSLVVDPRHIFVVYSDTPEHQKLFAVYYYEEYNDLGQAQGYMVHLYTKTSIFTYHTDNIRKGELTLISSRNHYFSGVPVVEYWNNEEASGDFEDVLSLIDAYNLLQSDRVNDVERFVQAILFLKNFSLDGDDAEMLRQKRILQAFGSEDVDAKWLVNALDQNGVEIVRKTLEQDIHKFSFVPAVTDDHFAGNVSGVAMKYKLIGLSQMNKIKKRYMERGLRERLGLVCCLPNFHLMVPVEEIDIEFTHSLPVNDLEIAQMVNALSGMVSKETLIAQLSFVKDPKEEAKELREEA